MYSVCVFLDRYIYLCVYTHTHTHTYIVLLSEVAKELSTNKVIDHFCAVLCGKNPTLSAILMCAVHSENFAHP
jgi:hypothetical protein